MKPETHKEVTDLSANLYIETANKSLLASALEMNSFQNDLLDGSQAEDNPTTLSFQGQETDSNANCYFDIFLY